MKTIICIKGAAQVGKTSTIKEVFKLLDLDKEAFKVEKFKEEKWLWDFYTILIHKETNKKIGISSLGDPVINQRVNLDYLAKNSCDVIVCASRTRGETLANVYEIAENYDYTIIQTGNFYGEGLPFKELNVAFAQAVVQIISLLMAKES